MFGRASASLEQEANFTVHPGSRYFMKSRFQIYSDCSLSKIEVNLVLMRDRDKILHCEISISTSSSSHLRTEDQLTKAKKKWK